MSDAELAKLLDCKAAGVKKLKKKGAPANSDGTWDLFRVYGFLCRLAKRRRKE
jgi:hypothetical protein